eukprot:TRINITY_DN22696_c0_g1_i1.p1 TRINITY_DN22696_c0_g1~~TRINITY_DN22696_c0_g1_i1.p1  ORF type:complete len:383 (+),score=125.76 TRINITY_DN22696_c0_g1_i1:92-1150(+)
MTDASGRPITVVPGDILTEKGKDWLHGQGTYEIREHPDGAHVGDAATHLLHASVCGQVQMADRLIRVVPPKGRYVGCTGDCVVGRVSQIGAGKWRVDLGAHLDAVLLISNVNLPGGHLRRKTSEDVKHMRSFFQEGDLLSAEVQKVGRDGAPSLHTRSARYGKLDQGTLVEVPPTLVRRLRTHFHTFDFGVSAIIGINGWVWLHKTPRGGYGEAPAKRRREGAAGGSDSDDESEAVQQTVKRSIGDGSKREELKELVHLPPTVEDRMNIARLRAAIKLLAGAHLEISPLTMLDVYRASVDRNLRPPEMPLPQHREPLLQHAAERARSGGAMHRTRKRGRAALAPAGEPRAKK